MFFSYSDDQPLLFFFVQLRIGYCACFLAAFWCHETYTLYRHTNHCSIVALSALSVSLVNLYSDNLLSKSETFVARSLFEALCVREERGALSAR